jgi:N-acetylmuramoyl-L-alanine amidase
MAKRKVNEIVIHCSDSTFGNAAIIDSWHRKRKPPFKKIGYHFVICRDGEIEEGRGLEEVGAHVKGRNRHTIGICVIGKLLFTYEEKMPDVQKAALMRLIHHLTEMYPDAKIRGHYELDRGKSCPNFCMTQFRLDYYEAKKNGAFLT